MLVCGRVWVEWDFFSPKSGGGGGGGVGGAEDWGGVLEKGRNRRREGHVTNRRQINDTRAGRRPVPRPQVPGDRPLSPRVTAPDSRRPPPALRQRAKCDTSSLRQITG